MIVAYVASALALGSPGEAVTGTCAPGVYAVAKTGELTPLSQVKADHRKVTNMMGAMLLGPLGGNRMKIKTVVSGPAAAIKIHDVRPVFQFCFTPITTGDASSDYVGTTVAATPRDYKLVRFEQTNGQRELALAAAGGFAGPKGQLSKSSVPFTVEEVAPGQYRVILSGDLQPGEYGFLSAVSAPASARKKDVQELVYDFGVTG